MPKRTSIAIEGFDHGAQPIPAACRMGRVIMTSGIYGLDTATGKVPDDVALQTQHMFANLARILEAAGAGLDNVVKMVVYVKAPEARAAVNDAWVKAFSDPQSRPARQAFQNDHLPANVAVQCEVTAILDAEER